MKNKATIIKLIITMISTIVVLVIGACVYKNNINKAKCAHIDENIDMRCDKCDAILLFKDIAQYQEIEEETQRGAKVKVKGNMPQNIKISAQDIAKEQAEQLLKSFNLQIEKEKIYAAYNITLKSKQKKYQPVEYGESVKVDIVDEQIVSDSEMSLLHIINGEEYEIVPLNIKSTNELTFETTSFSTYILINVANYSLKFNDTERYIAYSMRGRELQNEIKVLQNENYTFTIKPKEGYKLENITITSGELIQKGNTFGRTATIKSINTDIEVNVATTETPKITKQPITQKVKSGDTVIYQTEIQNTNGEVAYEWQYRNNGTGSFSKIPDTVGIANENTLTISNVNEDLNGYEIRCLISDQDYKEYNRIITDKALLIVAEGTIEDEYKKLDTSKYMITEWNVSGDAGLTITLPASGTDLNISVDWGDGSADIITTEFPTHTYASAGVYEIKVAGNCPIWGNNSVDTISETSNYYTYTKYLTKVKQFGELNATRYGFANCENLIQVQGENLVLAKTFENVENMAYMFYKCSNLKNIDASKFDTSKVTDMSWMFRECSSLTSLDLSNFNTSKVTNMSFMFHWCQALTSLNVNNFDTSKVTNMQLMFGYCNNLQTIDVSGFNTSEVTTMRGMFAFCSNLTKLDVSNFDTLKVTDIITMFRSCSNLTSLDISNFNTFNATEIDMAFGTCTNLKTLQLSNKFKIPTSNVVANLFISTPNLTSIIIVDSEPLPEQFTRLVEKLEGKTIYVPNEEAEIAYEEAWSGDFSGDKIQPILELSGEKTVTIGLGSTYTDAGYTVAGLTLADSDAYTCYGYSVTQKITLDTNKEGNYEITYTLNKKGEAIASITRNINVVDRSKYMITEWNVSGDAGLTITLPASGTDLNISVDWGDGSADIITTEFPTHTYASAGVYEIKVAGNCPIWGNNSVDTISETSNYYTYTKYLTKVKQFGELNATRYGFANCENLIQVQGENLVLAKTFENVENMAYMFYKCSNLKNIDASKFDTSKVTDMSWMFRECSSLTSLDLSNFNTSKVTNMSFMFHWCQALTSLNVNNFDTSKVTNMQLMFGYCNNLQTIDVSGFNTSEVTTMRGMFAFCSNLTKLDVSNFDTLKVTDIITMFRSCSNLTSLDISNFNTFNATEIDMAFGTCTNLKTLQLSNKFKIPTSNVVANLFISTPNLTSIIIVDSEPLPEQFTRLVEKLEGKTIYVPNEEAEIAYEEAWSGDFSGDRIQPILELVGDEKTKLSVSEEAYTDAGYTVAGLTEIDSNAYTCYGYNVTSSGEVNRREAGIYKITYQITRTYEKDGQTITTEPYEVTREIEVEALTIEIPTMIGEYTYTGILQTLQLKNLDTSKMEITGNTATNVGSYTATIKIKNKKMYAWKDGTTQDINITWEIKPIIAEITWNITTIEYDGTPKQIVATVSNTVNGESVTVTAYDGTISATDVGEYTAKVKSLSSTNYTLEGALNTEKIWQIKIAVIDMEVIMQDYSYGGTLVNPSITNNEAERNVVYYYSTEDASKGGTDWSTVTNSLSIPVGTYYMYAIVEATQNYQETITDPVMFKVLTTQLQINMTTEDDQYYQNEWTNQSVYIALTQNGGANVTAYQYKIGTSGSWIDQVTLPIVIENTTNDEIKVRGVNPAGRVVTEETSAGVVKIDKTNPTIANETYKHENKILSVVFKLNDGQSGISAYAITPRENMIKEWITSEEGTKQVEVSGSGTYYIWAKDKVGNTAYKTIKVIKDIIPPTAQITVKEAYTTENNKYYVNQNTVTISVDASDNQTPKAQIQMAIYKEADYKALTSEDDIVWEAYKLDNEWTVQKENAEEKVYVILKDLAGNITVKVGE